MRKKSMNNYRKIYLISSLIIVLLSNIFNLDRDIKITNTDIFLTGTHFLLLVSFSLLFSSFYINQSNVSSKLIIVNYGLNVFVAIVFIIAFRYLDTSQPKRYFSRESHLANVFHPEYFAFLFGIALILFVFAQILFLFIVKKAFFESKTNN